MSKWFHILLVLGLVSLGSCGGGDGVLPSTVGSTVHVFMLAGQSNMVGRDVTPFSFATDPRILNFSDGRAGTALDQIEVANDPLRHDKPGVAYGTNLGRPFARALLPNLPAGDKILLVDRAWGGTSIAEWNRDHGPTGYSSASGYDLPVNPYVTAVNDYKAAFAAVTANGDIPVHGGILWLQGETDVDDQTPPDAYRSAVVATLTLMRQDLGDPNMKVGIAEFYEDYGGAVGAALRATLPLIAQDLGGAFSSSQGAVVLADGVHMTTASHATNGARMAQAYMALK